MLQVGLTGGIGSGKSTVAAMLADRGALVVDADELARQVLAPGEPAVSRVVEAFGDTVLAPDGSLDRATLASLIFGDPAKRAQLESIVHPEVAARAAETMAGVPQGTVVVYDVPLLVEKDMAGLFDVVVVVLADEETRLPRLTARGLSHDDAVGRIAAQADDEARRAVADVLIDNSGTLARLGTEVDDLWALLNERMSSTG